MEFAMTRKELNEIKSQYTLEDCGILRLCGCYVDGERNKITQFNENFLNLPEEEKHKYFEKSLSLYILLLTYMMGQSRNQIKK